MNEAKLGTKHRLTLSRAKDLGAALLLSGNLKESKKVLNKSIRKAESAVGAKDSLTLRLY